MKLLRIFVLTLFSFLPLGAFAQTVPITAHLTDGQGNAVAGAYLHFELYNCGTNFPTATGAGLSIVQRSFDLLPNASGLITGVVWPNDMIKCGNIASTLWTVTLMKSGATPLNASLRYNICSMTASGPSCAQAGGPGTVFDPSTAQPAQVSGSLVNYIPGPPGYILLLSNAPNTQNWVQPPGTRANFTGSFLFNQGIFSGPVFFSQLGGLVGTANVVYVQDATFGSNPCTGSGSGAFAFYVGGTWTCSLGSSGGSSSFSGAVGRIPLYTSSTGGANSCLGDSNTGTGGSIFNNCGTENFNLASFSSLTWPLNVTMTGLNATTATVGTGTFGNFLLAGPAYVTSICPSAPPVNPAAGHSVLGVLYPSCLFGEYPAGGTGFFNFPMQYSNFPTGGNVSASGPNTLYGDASYVSATAPGYAGSDNCVSILAAENANTTYATDIDARGFQGLFTCATTSINSLFSPLYQGNFQAGPWQMQPSAGIGIPRKSQLHGAGWQTGNGQPFVGATVFQATNLPINTPLMGFTDDNVGFNFNNGPVFDSPVDEITLDCVSVSGCIGFAAYVPQEGSGVFRSNILGFGNHGVGLKVGGYDVPVAPGTPNNVYGQPVACNASTCTISLANPQVAGNLIAICGRWLPFGVTLLSAANGTNNDAYIPVPNSAVVDGTNQAGGCVYDNNVNAGTGTIVLTFSGTITTNTLYVAAIDEPNVRSVDIAGAAVSTTSGPGPTVTTTNVDQFNPDDFIVGMALTGTNSSTWAAGAGFTSGKATGNVGVEYQTQTTTGNYPTPWISSNVSRTMLFTLALASGTNNGAGPQNSWFAGLDFSMSSGTTITRDARCLDINTGGSSGPKELANFTCTAQGNSAAPPNELYTIASSGTTYINHHLENAGVAAVMNGEDGAAHSNIYANINVGNMNVALSFTLTAATESGNVATFTTSTPCAGLVAGQPIITSGITPSGYNQTSTQLIPFTVATTCVGSTFTANLTTSGLGAGSVFGTVTVENALFAFSNNHANGTGGNVILNLYAAGPKYPYLTLNDEVNQNYVTTLQEPYISFYATGGSGSIAPGSGAGESVLTTSGQIPSVLWALNPQLIKSGYDCAARYGDCQAGSQNQVPARLGYFTIPQGQTQMVVSTYAIQDLQSHVKLDDAAGNCAYFGGFPATCNTTGFFKFKVVALQPAVNPYPLNGLTPYGPTTALTGSSFTTNTVTLTMASTAGFAVHNIVRVAGNSINTGGPFNLGYNGMGYITGLTGTTLTYTLTFGSAITTCAASCGTVQIWPGFVAAVDTTPSTADLVVGFSVED